MTFCHVNFFSRELKLIASQAYDKWGNVICHGDKSVIKEGHKSFPSGHASCKFLLYWQLMFIFCWDDENFQIVKILFNSSSSHFHTVSFGGFLDSFFRVLCRDGFSFTVLVWKNQSIWSQRTCCKTMHCFSSSVGCITCGHFSSGWLLAPLAGCLCWRSPRLVLL